MRFLNTVFIFIILSVGIPAYSQLPSGKTVSLFASDQFRYIIPPPEQEKGPLSFGVKFMVGASNLKKSAMAQVTHLAYAIGPTLNYEFNPTVSFQSELFFARKGFSSLIQITNQYGQVQSYSKLSYSLFYGELPLMIRFTSGGNKTKAYFMTGVAPAVYLGGSATLEGFGSSKPENINSLDLGSNSGLGLAFDIGKWWSFVEFRLNSGLKSINNSSQERNIVYGFSSGVIF